jgi:single-stranded DNA-binding protein
MSGIECAFFGVLGRDAEAKTSKAGKHYLRLNVRVGEGDGASWVSVLAFDAHATEAAAKFVKGARATPKAQFGSRKWTAQDGTKRQCLSCMSWHCRLAEIGRNKPARPRKPEDKANAAAPPGRNNFHDDPLPF